MLSSPCDVNLATSGTFILKMAMSRGGGIETAILHYLLLWTLHNKTQEKTTILRILDEILKNKIIV